jgi:hypothetical protein
LPHRITTSSALSPAIWADFPSSMMLSSKICLTFSWPNLQISSSVGSKICRTLGGSHE